MGTYTVFKLTRGIHTVSAEQSVPLRWIRLDNRDEALIFLYFRYETGEFTELDADTGKTTVMKYKPCKPMEDEYGSSARRAATRSVRSRFGATGNSSEPFRPRANSASGFPRENTSSIRESAPPMTIRSRCSRTPQKKTGKNAWVTADLAAGKRYFVRLDVGLSGTFGYQVALTAAKGDAATKAAVASLKPLVTDSARIDATVRARLDAAKPELAKKTSDEITKLLFSKPLNLNASDGTE